MDEDEKELYAIVVEFRRRLGGLGLPPVVQDALMQFMHSLINCTKRVERNKIARWLLDDQLSAYGYSVRRGDYEPSSERTSSSDARDVDGGRGECGDL